jgi:hypothetical protein
MAALPGRPASVPKICPASLIGTPNVLSALPVEI